MCGRYARQREFEFAAGDREALDDLNPMLADQLMQREPAYNICPTQIQPVIALGSENQVEMKGLRWGLVPSWARDLKSGQDDQRPDGNCPRETELPQRIQEAPSAGASDRILRMDR